MWRSVQIAAAVALAVSAVMVGCGRRAGEREFSQGVRQFERQRPVRARDHFEQSINARPGHPANAETYHYLGLIAWQLDDPEGAAAYFERSQELNPRLYEPVFSLGALAFEQGDGRRARTLFRTASQLRPGDVRPLEYMAETYLREHAYADARRTLQSALERSPHAPRLLTRLGVVEHRAGQADEAGASFMQALEVDPGYLPALYNLAMVRAADPGNREHALEYLTQYIQAERDDRRRRQAEETLLALRDQPAPETRAERKAPLDEPEPRGEEPEDDREERWEDRLAATRRLADEGEIGAAVARCLRLAAVARRAGRDDHVKQALEQALEYDPRSPAVWQEMGRWHAARARHGEAVNAFRQAAEREPDWVETWSDLADSAWAEGDLDVALDAQRRSVSLDPDNAHRMWLLAERYDQSGVRRRAAETYEQFTERFATDPRASVARNRLAALRPPDPLDQAGPVPPQVGGRDPNVLAAREAFQRGMAYQRRGDDGNALAFYRRALEHDPSLEPAHYNTGVIHLARGELGPARAAFRRSVELKSDNVNALYNLALTLFRLGEHVESMAYLESALHIDRGFAPAHLLLGTLYARDRRTHREAGVHYRRYLELRPTAPEAATIENWLAHHG